MTTNTAPVLLVDGSSYLYRAFHAMAKADLRNTKGMPTGAVRGVVSMLRSLVKEYPESVVAVVFDAKGKTFRDEIYAEYKANRPPMPDDLRSQIEPLHKIIRAMGFPMLIVDGVEADDVIGTLARQASDKGMDVVISTGDKDMAQLVNKHVMLVNTMTGTKMDVAGVVEKFGVKPEQIIDYLALMGDKVDNIPGVEKCGPKTAVKWLAEYDTLQGVMDNADQVKGKVGENLRSAIPDLPMSYELATIKTDVELDVSVDQLAHASPEKETLRELFGELEFKSWLDELDQEGGADGQPIPELVDTEYETVTDLDTYNRWLESIRSAKIFAFDTETTSLNYMEAKVVGVSFSVEAGKAAYVPFGHDYPDAPQQLTEEEVLGLLKPVLEDVSILKIGQNLKYDRSVLVNHGIEMRGIAYDTMLESYVLNSTANRHDMDTLALAHLGRSTIHFEDIAGKGAKQLTFNQIPLENAGPYAAEDADITLQLHQKLWPELEAIGPLKNVFEKIELPLLKVLSKIERNGALINSDSLAQQSREHGKTMAELEKQAYDIAGEEFNLASPKQLGSVLFDKLGLPVIKKTPKGAPSTAEEVLQELALDYPLPKVIMQYRGLAKLKSTYTDKLPLMVNPQTGRVHTSYHQAVAATGRLSSTDPNLQNIPIRTEEGRRIRQAFIARPGYRIVAADYSQIELRIMAHLSGDQGLRSAFADGLDIHKATAAEVFDVDLDNVSAEQRRSAKAINFGLIYGMSAFGLAKQLHIGRNDAQSYIDTYFHRYPGVAQFMDDIRRKASEQGYVETLMGRRLYLPEINARNGMRRQAAERTAINAPMQGTAADIIKMAMIKVDAWLEESDVDALMIMQVHDELVLEVAEQDLSRVKEELSALMSGAVELSVPLVVEVGEGENWDEAH
ncbi:DNA polymerase I [Teredinibacter sp. KSP-S5-2]|uniref:DNA polymerase I n=1 Tax=Teredinibacter sp. KSP-S5-2 TaxID=3034506 RepID=UPI0029352BD4|nr:DNA polymerase I [Teredinibacter sp. KSP-S5-2]WNO09219.1 DNA polymerase I [Teredinibacter sp. KSP-S5-2]